MEICYENAINLFKEKKHIVCVFCNKIFISLRDYPINQSSNVHRIHKNIMDHISKRRL